MKHYKGRVVNIEDSIAHVFTTDGEIVRIQRLGDMTMGQSVLFTDHDIVPIKRRIANWSRVRALVVPVLIFFMMIGLYQYNEIEAYAAIAVDINPSMTLLLDRNANILRIETHNEDAVDLLSTMQPLKGTSAVEAIAAIIKASDLQYLTDSNDDVFLAAAVLRQGIALEPETILEEVVDAAVNTAFDEDVSIYTATLDSSVYRASKAEKVSMATYVLSHEAETESASEPAAANTDAAQAVNESNRPETAQKTNSNQNSSAQSDIQNKDQSNDQNNDQNSDQSSDDGPQANENALIHANENARMFKLTQIDQGSKEKGTGTAKEQGSQSDTDDSDEDAVDADELNTQNMKNSSQSKQQSGAEDSTSDNNQNVNPNNNNDSNTQQDSNGKGQTNQQPNGNVNGQGNGNANNANRDSSDALSPDSQGNSERLEEEASETVTEKPSSELPSPDLPESEVPSELMPGDTSEDDASEKPVSDEDTDVSEDASKGGNGNGQSNGNSKATDEGGNGIPGKRDKVSSPVDSVQPKN
jgi:hypothetical protein